MARKAWGFALLLAIVISLGVFTLKGFGKEQKLGGKMDLSAVSEKIDEVLKNQQDIIARLTDIREQQHIIKIRASRR
ncbi:hypothetical protein ACFL0P_03345 [Candidatus Omnitrophota bacterium]